MLSISISPPGVFFCVRFSIYPLYICLISMYNPSIYMFLLHIYLVVYISFFVYYFRECVNRTFSLCVFFLCMYVPHMYTSPVYISLYMYIALYISSVCFLYIYVSYVYITSIYLFLYIHVLPMCIFPYMSLPYTYPLCIYLPRMYVFPYVCLSIYFLCIFPPYVPSVCLLHAYLLNVYNSPVCIYLHVYVPPKLDSRAEGREGAVQ